MGGHDVMYTLTSVNELTLPLLLFQSHTERKTGLI